MPVNPTKSRLFDGIIEPELLLFIDARYVDSYPGGNTVINLANGNAESIGNGTITGNVDFDAEEGGCFVFPTTSPGNIFFASNTIGDVTTRQNWSISAYVKPTRSQALQFNSSSIFGCISSTGNSSFNIGYGAGLGGFSERFYWGGTGTTIVSSQTYPINDWYHIVWTKVYNTGAATTQIATYRLYVNGSLVLQDTSKDTGINITDLYVGRGFAGKISSVKIFTETLSPAQVMKEFTSARVKLSSLGTKKTSTDIILYLNDKGNNSGWGDNSMYSNGATLIGNVQFENGLILPGLSTVNCAQGKLSVNPGQNFTISAFVTPTAAGTTILNTIISTAGSTNFATLGSISPSLGILFSLNQSTKAIRINYLDNVSVESAANSWDYNESFHVALTVEESGGNRIIKIFKNGNLIKSQTVALSFTFALLDYRIGYWNTGYRHPFNGKIWNVLMYNRTLSDTEVKNLYTALPTSYKSNESTLNQAPQANKIMYLDGAEPKSYYFVGTNVNDLTGFGRNGTLTSDSGSPPTFSQFFSGHFKFRGLSTKSFISFSPTNLPDQQKPYSVVCWFRPNDISKTQVIYMYGNENSPYLSRGVSIFSGSPCAFQDRTTDVLNSGISLEVGKWYQVVHTYSGNQEFIYVNGILGSSRNRTFNTSLSSASGRIGAGFFKLPPSTGSIIDFYFDGDIGEFTMYNRAIDPQEVYQDYYIKKNRYKALDVTRPSGSGTPTVPFVQTTAVTNTTTTSADSGGSILSTGGRAITARGLLVSQTTDPTLSSYLQIYTDPSALQGSFTTQITGLSPGVTYYARAYATNQIGTGYGNSIQFVAVGIVLPGVIAVTASTTQNTAGVTSSITDLGNATDVSARGVIWNTSTINPATVNLSTYTNKLLETGNFPLGEFFQTVTGLNPNTNYYLRAVASNSAGNKISDNEIVFRTKVATPLPTVSIVIVDQFNDITTNSVKIRVTTSGTNITQQGIVWNNSDGTPDWQTMFDAVTSQNLPNGGTFDLTTTSTLTQGAPYWFWGYAINSAGTAYSSPVLVVNTDDVPTVTTQVFFNTGEVQGLLNSSNGSTVTEVGIEWYDSNQLDILDTYSEIGLFEDLYSFTSFPPNLSLSGLIYARVYAINSVGIGYGDFLNQNLTALPLVTTVSSSINGQVVTMNGTLVNLGGAPNCTVGFYYGTTDPPTTQIAGSPNTLTTTGAFSAITPTLAPGNYFYYAYATNVSGTSPGLTKTFTIASTVPTISTTYSNDIILSGGLSMQLTATNITNNPTTRGFVWATNPNPTDAITDNITSKGTGTLTFTSSIPTDSVQQLSIPADTTIYVRAYARNASGVGYSENLTIYSANISVLAQINTGKLVYTGTINGTLTGPKTVNRGAVWSTSPITEAVLRAGSATSTTGMGSGGVNGSWGIANGDTEGTIIAAAANTLYYVRAWVKLSAQYGGHIVYSKQSATTLPPTVSDTVSTSNVTGTTVDITGQVISENNANVTSMGVCYGTSVAPTTSNTVTTVTTVIGSNFTTTITGLSLDTTYYFRVYATNASGTSYSSGNGASITTTNVAQLTTAAATSVAGTTVTLGGTITSNGGSAITERGVVWSTSQNPTTSSNKQTGGATTTFTVNVTGLTLGTLYYARAYAINGNGTSYGSQVSFTMDNIPTLTTTAISSITSTSAASGGNISADGGASVTARGVIWSTSQNPTIALSTKTTDGTGTGTFTSNITGLTDNTLYYVRAYATNTYGTAYGNQVSFTALTLVTPTLQLAQSNIVIVDYLVPANSNLRASVDTITGNPTSRGVIWSTSQNPTIALSTKTSDGSGNLAFSTTVPVSPQTIVMNTQYYLRAYATNGSLTGYSNQISIYTREIQLSNWQSLRRSKTVDILIPFTGTIDDSYTGMIVVWNTVPLTIFGQSGNTSVSVATQQAGTLITVDIGQGMPAAGTTIYIRASATFTAYNTIVYSNQLTVVI